MRVFRLALLAVTIALSSTAIRAADPPMPPETPKPEKEHEWLKQFKGEWTSTVEIFAMPGQPAFPATGSETVKSLGDFWIISESKMVMGEMKMDSMFTVGYDTEKKKFVGTWHDSLSTYMWKYEGTLNKEGTALTLDTEGPCPCMGGKHTKFKEVTEFKNKDHKVFTSSYLDEKGKWVLMVKMDSKRKK